MQYRSPAALREPWGLEVSLCGTWLSLAFPTPCLAQTWSQTPTILDTRPQSDQRANQGKDHFLFDHYKIMYLRQWWCNVRQCTMVSPYSSIYRGRIYVGQTEGNRQWGNLKLRRVLFNINNNTCVFSASKEETPTPTEFRDLVQGFATQHVGLKRLTETTFPKNVDLWKLLGDLHGIACKHTQTNLGIW